ncbi:MAG: RsmE family RNA methyltransferase [Candidatus Dependentiae bacterium]|nr:RsmE family RNA methyltransferase [Candidatus Dependentiae bacterium]
MNRAKHEFSLHLGSLSQLLKSINQGLEWSIDDETLHHRISKVLRLIEGDTVILFDRLINAQCLIRAMHGKKRIVFQLLVKEKNTILVPHITCVLPLLKRDDFESALYMLAELGVNSVQLVTTDKSVRSWGDKERERVERILIAAAEQSKHFAMPLINAPIALQEFCVASSKVVAAKIYFDVEGESLLYHLNKNTSVKPEQCMLMVGPEGDLTVDEKVMVQQTGFAFCKLTPTTLRAVHAVCLGVGAFRSL